MVCFSGSMAFALEQEKSHTEKAVTEHVGDNTHESADSESFDPAEVIMHHIKDAHEWHIFTTKDGRHFSVPLPVILYSRHSGFHVFMSGKLAHEHQYKGFKLGHGSMLMKNKDGEMVEKSVDGKIVELGVDGYLVEEGLPLDFSFTKNVFMMFLAVLILLVVFLRMAATYRKRGVSAPKGMQGFLEPLIVFVEEDIAIPNIGEDNYARFMPYLLTVFFFILIHNLMGLVPFFPFGANVTGNIAVTFVLATFTLFITNLNGNKEYWRHVFAAPGVPFWLLPIMIPIELLGIITKPFALMIRLFANITAGHIIILSLVSLIFIFKSVFMSIPSMIMVLFMDLIELLVAFLQAYIFTLLSALFIGLAMPEHHHE
ncbi:MAG: F0F1 ATP synthase subunit A [Bacteroidales bacterium]|nr:F0F1 ATP synthase subunit A [Bacteroidales bacterium]